MGGGDYPVVKDRAVERYIGFVLPAAKIPDTTDKKAISEAVLKDGKVILGESRNRESN